MSGINRRDFLRSAGGVTFLALTPVGRGLFAGPATESNPRLPLFTVLPYIQPGSKSLLRDGHESLVVAWQTNPPIADFAVDFGVTDQYGQTATITHAPRVAGRAGNVEARYNWTAELSGLALGLKYFYRVRGNGRFSRRALRPPGSPRGPKIRFVSFGDNSYGDISDRAIAYHTYRQNPDFVMNCGDNVYESGTDDEYQRFFFPVYNADVAAPRVSGPLNHDVADICR